MQTHFGLIETPNSDDPGPPPKRYVWPWLLAGAIILAILLAVLWMKHEVDRTRRLRALNFPAVNGWPVVPQTSSNAGRFGWLLAVSFLPFGFDLEVDQLA